MNQPILVFPRHRASNTPVKYQWIYNLTAANSLEFDALTFPNLKKHWQTFRQRGSLGGVAAFVNGQMVGSRYSCREYERVKFCVTR